VICQRFKNKKTEGSTNHTCFMNWSKGATSIEADAVAEGFKKSVEMHGLKFNKLIGKIIIYIINYYNYSISNAVVKL